MVKQAESTIKQSACNKPYLRIANLKKKKEHFSTLDVLSFASVSKTSSFNTYIF